LGEKRVIIITSKIQLFLEASVSKSYMGTT
jgi:hypothetical protein